MLISPDPEATKQAARDQFVAHVKDTYSRLYGHPPGQRMMDGMRTLAVVLSAMGQGELSTHGPDTAAKAMIGACEVIVKEFGPDDGD